MPSLSRELPSLMANWNADFLRHITIVSSSGRFSRYDRHRKFGLRFFHFAFACLLYSIWRASDLLVQAKSIGEYEHSPIVTADNTLTLLKKEPGIG